MCFELQERFAEVTINDPVNGDIIGYIYLFENTGEVMAPDAGEKLVLYDFKLTNNGDYFKNYTFTCPELLSYNQVIIFMGIICDWMTKAVRKTIKLSQLHWFFSWASNMMVKGYF